MTSKSVAAVFCCAWLSTAIAVAITAYFTGSAWCLFAMLIPANMGTKEGGKKIK